MATEQEPVDDLETDDDEDSAPEPVEVPDNPNEPVEVVTDEARKESRRAKRAERQSQFRQATEDAARLRAENEQLRRQPAYQPPQQQQQPNVHAQRLNQLDEAQRRLQAEYTAVASRPGYDTNSDQHRDFERRNNEIQVARMATVADARAPQINEPELLRKLAWQQFTSEHNDVFSHPQAYQWGVGEYYKRIAEGHPDTKEMAEDLLDATRLRFGMKPRKSRGSAPDPATKQRFSGVASRAGGAAPEAGKIQMDANQKRMARIAFMKDGVTEAQAYQKWANTAGKELQKLQARKGQ
jgi:hypothetical protein